MKLKVTDKGLVIPKTYLEGISEVEIKKQTVLLWLYQLPTSIQSSSWGRNRLFAAHRMRPRNTTNIFMTFNYAIFVS